MTRAVEDGRAASAARRRFGRSRRYAARPRRLTRTARRLPTIGVDIGGTKVLAGLVDGDGRTLRSVRLDTPGRNQPASVVEEVMVAAVEDLRSTHEVAAVGVGAAGFVDATRSTVLFAPHLSWRREPLRERLEQRLGLVVLIDNDANTTALAEVRYGAARGRRQVLCVTLGTGIGGALVIDGALYRGAHGLAGEFGHMQVVPDGRPCECGNRGCWEQYSSGNALVREAREFVRARSPAAARLSALVDGDPERLSGPVVTEAALQGDQVAVELFTVVGSWLGAGLAGLSAAFDPETIVVGGGVSAAGELLLGPARETFARRLTGRGFRPEPPIVAAGLGPDAGFVGAAVMAREAITAR